MPAAQPPKLKTALRNGNDRHIVLQKRDLRILDALSILRLIDREQTSFLASFKSLTRVNSRLQKLRRAGLLKRFFFVSALGGKRAIYSLSKKGAELMGVPPNGIQRPSDSFLIGDRFVAHQLAINEIYCHAIAGTAGGPRVKNWRSIAKPLTPSTALIPDAYFEIHSEETVRPMFLEVDRGTESLSLWTKKTESYIRLAASGEFEAIFRRPRFAVLVVTLSERRMHSLRVHIKKTTSKLFYFSTLERIKSEGLWSPIWFRPDGEDFHSLT